MNEVRLMSRYHGVSVRTISEGVSYLKGGRETCQQVMNLGSLGNDTVCNTVAVVCFIVDGNVNGLLGGYWGGDGEEGVHGRM